MRRKVEMKEQAAQETEMVMRLRNEMEQERHMMAEKRRQEKEYL